MQLYWKLIPQFFWNMTWNENSMKCFHTVVEELLINQNLTPFGFSNIAIYSLAAFNFNIGTWGPALNPVTRELPSYQSSRSCRSDGSSPIGGVFLRHHTCWFGSGRAICSFLLPRQTQLCSQRCAVAPEIFQWAGAMVPQTSPYGGGTRRGCRRSGEY